MIERVNHISKDPLQAAHEEEERLLLEEMMEQELAEHEDQIDEMNPKSYQDSGTMETEILE